MLLSYKTRKKTFPRSPSQHWWVATYDFPIASSGVLLLFACTIKIQIASYTPSMHITVYLHWVRRRRPPPHPDTKSRNENDAKTTTMTITVDFFEESIDISRDLRKKTTKHKNVSTTISTTFGTKKTKLPQLQYDEI